VSFGSVAGAGRARSMSREMRGLPPRTSRAAACSDSVWCWWSQSRVYVFGAEILMWSPSTAVSRQGRSQESSAVGGTLEARAIRMRFHRESSIAKAVQDCGERELRTELSTGVDNEWRYRDRGVLRARQAKPAAEVSSGSDGSAGATPPDASRSPGVSPAIPKIAGSVRTARYHTAKRTRKRVRVLTCQRPVSTLRRFYDRGKEFVHEADVPAEQTPPEEDTRLPGADEDSWRAEGSQAPAREGAQASHRLAGLL
jgi:hypothetical protein